MRNVVEDFLLEPASRERLSGLVGPEDENLKQILDSILHDTDQEKLSEINSNLMQKLLTSSKERHHLELEDDDEFSQEYDTSLFEEI